MHRPSELTLRGIPFPLYRGSLETISGLVTSGTCVGCHRTAPYLFELGHGDYVLDTCHRCSSPTALAVGWADEAAPTSACRSCANLLSWPDGTSREGLAICYACVRSGRVAFAHGTNLGSADWEHTEEGRLDFGRLDAAERAGLRTTVLETYDDGSQRLGVHVPQAVLTELHRTPRYMSLQREYWYWHCGNFMPYLGRWDHDDFERQAPGRGREWFGAHMPPGETWEDMWEWLPTDTGWSYVHQCSTCGLHKVFVDAD